MFDLKWYKKMLQIVDRATTTPPLVGVEISQHIGDMKIRRENTKFKSEFDKNTIDLAYYLETYLQYFGLEFKEQYNSKVCNKHYKGC